jgi:hypothetical protein
VTARTYPDLLGLRGTDAGVQAAIEKLVGPGARLVGDESPDRFDVLPLLVATDGAIAEFGRDGRRLRPNIVVGGVKGLEERNWEGGELLVGDVTIGIHDLRARCNMTMVDPDTLDYDPNVLRDIVKRFGGKLALNCSVIKGGEIRVGQEVIVRL